MNKAFTAYSLASMGICPEATRGGSIGLANESALGNSFLSQPLGNFVVGWLADQKKLLDLLEYLAPSVKVARRFEFRARNTKDAFLALENDEDVRALYGEFKRLQSTGSVVQSKTLHKGFSKLIDSEEIRENPMAEEEAVAILTAALIRAEILRAVSLLNLAATNAAKTWSTGADADVDLLKAISAGGDTAGINPNRVLFGQTAWQNRVMGLRALDTAGGYASAGLTPEQLAAFLAIAGVKVCEERYETGSGKGALVTNNIVLAYNAQSGANKDDPSNIKRFVTDAGGTQFRVYRREVSSDLVEVTVSHCSNIVLTSSTGIRKLTIS